MITITKTDSVIARHGMVTDDVVVIPGGIDVLSLPRRSYDFNKGDRRFVDIDQAIDHANEAALHTGVRQIIRKDSQEPGAHGRPFYLVQAVGS